MIRRVFLTLAAVAFAGVAQAQDPSNTLVIEVEGVEANGVVEIELLPDLAPQHVDRIKELAAQGAYDGVAFHRVIEGFMAQTGDVEFATRDTVGLGRAGTGGSDLPDLPAEFSATPFLRGTVGMARAQDPNSANSQFFIMFDEGAFLNGQYTVFGRVTSGMEIIDKIQRGEGQSGAVPEPDFMSSVRLKGG
ncbi:MAG: peptidylprolyl isomerase [Pseudomonadota bacterium]